jgi:hypothetical protein
MSSSAVTSEPEKEYKITKINNDIVKANHIDITNYNSHNAIKTYRIVDAQHDFQDYLKETVNSLLIKHYYGINVEPKQQIKSVDGYERASCKITDSKNILHQTLDYKDIYPSDSGGNLTVTIDDTPIVEQTIPNVIEMNLNEIVNKDYKLKTSQINRSQDNLIRITGFRHDFEDTRVLPQLQKYLNLNRNNDTQIQFAKDITKLSAEQFFNPLFNGIDNKQENHHSYFAELLDPAPENKPLISLNNDKIITLLYACFNFNKKITPLFISLKKKMSDTNNKKTIWYFALHKDGKENEVSKKYYTINFGTSGSKKTSHPAPSIDTAVVYIRKHLLNQKLLAAKTKLTAVISNFFQLKTKVKRPSYTEFKRFYEDILIPACEKTLQKKFDNEHKQVALIAFKTIGDQMYLYDSMLYDSPESFVVTGDTFLGDYCFHTKSSNTIVTTIVPKLQYKYLVNGTNKNEKQIGINLTIFLKKTRELTPDEQKAAENARLAAEEKEKAAAAEKAVAAEKAAENARLAAVTKNSFNFKGLFIDLNHDGIGRKGDTNVTYKRNTSNEIKIPGHIICLLYYLCIHYGLLCNYINDKDNNKLSINKNEELISLGEDITDFFNKINEINSLGSIITIIKDNFSYCDRVMNIKDDGNLDLRMWNSTNGQLNEILKDILPTLYTYHKKNSDPDNCKYFNNNNYFTLYKLDHPIMINSLEKVYSSEMKGGAGEFSLFRPAAAGDGPSKLDSTRAVPDVGESDTQQYISDTDSQSIIINLIPQDSEASSSQASSSQASSSQASSSQASSSIASSSIASSSQASHSIASTYVDFLDKVDQENPLTKSEYIKTLLQELAYDIYEYNKFIDDNNNKDIIQTNKFTTKLLNDNVDILLENDNINEEFFCYELNDTSEYKQNGGDGNDDDDNTSVTSDKTLVDSDGEIEISTEQKRYYSNIYNLIESINRIENLIEALPPNNESINDNINNNLIEILNKIEKHNSTNKSGNTEEAPKIQSYQEKIRAQDIEIEEGKKEKDRIERKLQEQLKKVTKQNRTLKEAVHSLTEESLTKDRSGSLNSSDSDPVSDITGQSPHQDPFGTPTSSAPPSPNKTFGTPTSSAFTSPERDSSNPDSSKPKTKILPPFPSNKIDNEVNEVNKFNKDILRINTDLSPPSDNQTTSATPTFEQMSLNLKNPDNLLRSETTPKRKKSEMNLTGSPVSPEPKKRPKTPLHDSEEPKEGGQKKSRRQNYIKKNITRKKQN